MGGSSVDDCPCPAAHLSSAGHSEVICRPGTRRRASSLMKLGATVKRRVKWFAAVVAGAATFMVWSAGPAEAGTADVRRTLYLTDYPRRSDSQHPDPSHLPGSGLLPLSGAPVRRELPPDSAWQPAAANQLAPSEHLCLALRHRRRHQRSLPELVHAFGRHRQGRGRTDRLRHRGQRKLHDHRAPPRVVVSRAPSSGIAGRSAGTPPC